MGKGKRQRRQGRDPQEHRARGGTTGRRAMLYGAGAAALAGLVGWQLWAASRRAAGSVTTDSIGDKVQTLARDQLPEFATGGDLPRLYRYAVEHADELVYIPCFCGCSRFGHTSNHDCYVKAVHPDGTLTFTSHAAT